MMRRAAYAAVLFVLSGVCWTIAEDRSASRGEFEPVMPLDNLMVQQDRHFESIMSLLRSSDDKERFAKLRHEALALAEMANVNAYHEQAKEHDDYRNWAIGMKNDAKRLASLAAAKKVSEAREVAKAINKTCGACHDKYGG